jgi:hypothetical protein
MGLIAAGVLTEHADGTYPLRFIPENSMDEAIQQSTVPLIVSFNETVAAAINEFSSARLLRRVDAGSLDMHHYHAILTTLFHQTYAGPYTFARAGVNCNWRHEAAKEYLIQHAEEERTHWRWVLNDLKATEYTGPNPRNEPPHPTTQAFIGLMYYVAEEVPIARLGIAAVLEGIGAKLGGVYGGRLVTALNLQKSQVSFFLSHSQTDIIHTAELNEVIAASELTPEEWRWMNHAAQTGGQFYRAMYDHEAFA